MMATSHETRRDRSTLTRRARNLPESVMPRKVCTTVSLTRVGGAVVAGCGKVGGGVGVTVTVTVTVGVREGATEGVGVGVAAVGR